MSIRNQTLEKGKILFSAVFDSSSNTVTRYSLITFVLNDQLGLVHIAENVNKVMNVLTDNTVHVAKIVEVRHDLTTVAKLHDEQVYIFCHVMSPSSVRIPFVIIPRYKELVNTHS